MPTFVTTNKNENMEMVPYTEYNMQQQLRINPAQYELLNLLSCVNKDEDVAELKAIIVQFLNTRLQKEIDRLWDNGTLTEEKLAAWQNEHMRTPYKD